MLSQPSGPTPNRRNSWPWVLGLLIAFLLVGGHSSWAESYRYQTADGRWVISNSPPEVPAEVITKMPEGSGPSMQTTAQAPVGKPIKQLKKQQFKETNRRQKRHRRRRQKVPGPVNTHQFGLLKIGSHKKEVLRLIGPPEERIKEGKQRRLVRFKGYFAERKVKVETWHYPGSNRIRPTRLVFYNGRLAEKDKGWQ